MALAMLVSTMSAFALSASAAVPTQPKAPSNTGEKAFSTSDLDFDTVNGNVASTVDGVASGDKKLVRWKREVAGELNIGLTAVAPVDASGYEWLEFFFDCTEDTSLSKDKPLQVHFRLYSNGITEAVGHGAADDVAKKCTYALYQDGKWTTYAVNPGCQFYFPAGFSGYVRLKLDDNLIKAVTPYIGNGKPLDVSKMTGMWLYFTNGSSVGTSYYMNDFKFVKGALKDAAPDKPDQPDSPATGSVVPVIGFVAVAAASAMVVFATKKKRG